MITYDQLTQTTQSLSILQKKKIGGLVGYDLSSKKELSAGQAIVFWLADLLHSVSLCDVDQLYLLLECFIDIFHDFGDRLNKEIDANKLPVCFAMFGDRRYVSVSGSKSILDLQSGNVEDKYRLVPLEIISYNLTTLLFQRMNLIGKLKDEHHDIKQVA